MRVAVDRIAAQDEARDGVPAELDGRQQCIGLGGSLSRSDGRGAHAGRHDSGVLQELPPR